MPPPASQLKSATGGNQYTSHHSKSRAAEDSKIKASAFKKGGSHKPQDGDKKAYPKSTYPKSPAPDTFQI